MDPHAVSTSPQPGSYGRSVPLERSTKPKLSRSTTLTAQLFASMILKAVLPLTLTSLFWWTDFVGYTSSAVLDLTAIIQQAPQPQALQSQAPHQRQALERKDQPAKRCNPVR